MLNRKTVKKKFLGLVMVAALSVASLTGCGSDNKVVDNSDKKENAKVEMTTEEKSNEALDVAEASASDTKAADDTAKNDDADIEEPLDGANVSGNTDWKLPYKKFLTAVSRDFSYTEATIGDDKEVDFETFPRPNYYYLVYVDDDDIPELVVNYFMDQVTWQEYLYCIDGDSVKMVDFQSGDIQSDGFRSRFMFKEKTGEYAVQDGTGDMHYWDQFWIYDYNNKKELHYFSIQYQTETYYRVDDEDVSEQEAKDIILQYFDKFDVKVDEGIDFSGYDIPEEKKVTRENVISDFGDGEVTFEGGVYGQSANETRFTVPENFYDYSFASTTPEYRYDYWNQEYQMNIEYYEFEPNSSYSLSENLERYKKRENYSVEYEYINENTMVVSGYKPDGKTIYYTKESKSGNHAIKMVFEYPGTNESECGKILETFLDNVSY